MTRQDTSFLLVSPTESVLEGVKRAVTALPNAGLKTHRSSLAQVNGHAAEMAAGSDVVLFEADLRDETSLAAVRALVKAAGGASMLVALADASLSLANARMLQNEGVDEIIPLPCSDEDIAHIARKSMRARAAEPQGAGETSKQGSIIAVCRARGGIGATTIAVNLAYLLQDRRGLLHKNAMNRVAIVDLELQFGNVGIFLDVEDHGAMLDIAHSAHLPDRAFVRSAMIKRKCGLSVLPSPAKPIPLDALSPEKVAALMDALRAEYDFVVVDMPNALVDWIEPVLARAQKVLVATDTTVPGVRHARRLVNFYSEEAPALPIEIVVVHEKRPMFLSGHQKEASKVLERPLTHWLPHDAEAAIDAMDRGEPIVDFHAGSTLSRALRKMAKGITKSLEIKSTSANPQF